MYQRKSQDTEKPMHPADRAVLLIVHEKALEALFTNRVASSNFPENLKLSA
jgi:hypothetical protein